MITREDAQKLLAKKSLTGHEAGRLWMEDSFLVVRGQRGLLTEKEHRHMRSLVRTREDIETYNSYLDLYRRTEIALKDADNLTLLVKSSLLDLSLILKEYLDRGVSSWNRPPDRLASSKTSLDMIIIMILTDVKKYIGKFMAYKIRMEDLSKETGVDFGYDIRRSLEMINYGLERYNFYAGSPEVMSEKINLDKIKPDRQQIKDLYEIIYTIQQKGKDQEASDGKEA